MKKLIFLSVLYAMFLFDLTTLAISRPQVNQALKPAAPDSDKPRDRTERLKGDKENVSIFYERFRHQINTMIGIHVVKGSALLMGIQWGYRIDQKKPLFLGWEYNFSLYSPGSILGTLVGGWYEIPIDKTLGPRLTFGLVAGPAFTAGVQSTPTTVFLGCLDFTYSLPMDDLSDIRVQLRPGLMYHYFTYMMNLSIAFRLG